MRTEEIQQRLQDIRMELHSLDSLKVSNNVRYDYRVKL